jgi:hypothetical protein
MHVAFRCRRSFREAGRHDFFQAKRFFNRWRKTMSKNEPQTFKSGDIPEEFKAREFMDGQPDDAEAFLESDPVFAESGREFAEAPSWRAAKALLKLRNQVNAAFRNRSKRSDGFIGDTAHCPGSSDHCPLINHDGVGVVAAFDMTHDPNNGCDAQKIVSAIIESRDARIKYIIWNRHIWNSSPMDSQPAWAKRSYGGANPHTHHAHFSVLKDRTKYDDDVTEWVIARADA